MSYPVANFVNYDKFSLQHQSFLASITPSFEPASYNEVVRGEQMREAMRKEIQALKQNKTWTVEDLPFGKKAIGSKWVYKIKNNSNGSIE